MVKQYQFSDLQRKCHSSHNTKHEDCVNDTRQVWGGSFQQ